MVNLGDKVKDTVTGLVGIAVARTHWINGCDRITIQPQLKKGETKPPDNYTVDEPQVEIVSEKKVKKGKKDTGGAPSFSPTQK